MSLPRYPAYKESGATWVGLVPQHWSIGPLKRMLNIQNGADHKAVESEEGIPVIGSGGPFAFATDYLHDGESVLLGRKGTIDKPLYVTGRFWTVDTMYWSRVLPGTYGRFAYYSALTIPFDYYSTSTALPSMTKGILGAHLVARPPWDEQVAIATFLDHETAKIDALLAEQEKLITLLAEKRQATISQAVTRGLDPAVPMRDSGVAWLGAVPAHWVVTPLARIAMDRCDGPFGSGLKSEHYTEDGALVVRLQNIRAGCFRRGESVYVDLAYFLADLKGHDVVTGDLLVAGLGDENNLLGRACVAPPRLGFALVKADCFRFRLNAEQAISEFVAWQLSAGAAHDAGVLATGTTRSRIPLSVMASRKVALPPTTDEQWAIADFIATENARIDALSAEANRAITLLKERRSALIAAAVTGQIDVRSAVSQTHLLQKLAA